MPSAGSRYLLRLHSCLIHVLLSSVVSFFFFSFLFFRWQNVSLSGRGRPGLSDVSACSFLPCVCVACVCVCVCSVLCLSASCLPPRPLSTHFLPHTQSDAWPRLYLQPPFLRNSLHFLHMTFCLGCSRPPSRPTSSSPLSSFSFSFAWLTSPAQPLLQLDLGATEQ